MKSNLDPYFTLYAKVNLRLIKITCGKTNILPKYFENIFLWHGENFLNKIENREVTRGRLYKFDYVKFKILHGKR